MSFSVSPEHTDAILHASGYHRKDFDMAVTWFPAREHATVRTSLLSTPGYSMFSLGMLDRLPLELINMTCLELDMSSCFAFRHVNSRAQQVISSLPQYRIAVTHTLDCFCAILRTKVASFVTLNDYYARLCETTCSLCKINYGDLIHLLKWTRCCSACLRDHGPEVRVLTITAARRVLQLSSKILKSIPTLKTLPGTYTMDERAYKRRHTIVMSESALLAHRRKNKGVEVREDAHQQNLILAFMACCAFPSYDPVLGCVQNGVSCAGCQLAFQEGYYRNPTRDSVYTHTAFLQHFGTCEQAQRLWQSSRNESIKRVKMPYSCAKGGYFEPRE